MDPPHLENRWHHNGTDGNEEERKTTRMHKRFGEKTGDSKTGRSPWQTELGARGQGMGKQGICAAAQPQGWGCTGTASRCPLTHLAHLELLPAHPAPTSPAPLLQGRTAGAQGSTTSHREHPRICRAAQGSAAHAGKGPFSSKLNTQERSWVWIIWQMWLDVP